MHRRRWPSSKDEGEVALPRAGCSLLSVDGDMRGSTVDGKHRHGLQAHPLLQAQSHLRARLLLRWLSVTFGHLRAPGLYHHLAPHGVRSESKGCSLEASSLAPGRFRKVQSWKACGVPPGLSMSCQHGLKYSESFLHSHVRLAA